MPEGEHSTAGDCRLPECHIGPGRIRDWTRLPHVQEARNTSIGAAGINQRPSKHEEPSMSYYNPHWMTKVRSEHLMKAANGKPCTLRISSFFPGYSCSDGTTVGCHLPVGGKGTSTKETHLAVAFGCSHCHDILDGRDWKRAEYIVEKYPSAFAPDAYNCGERSIKTGWPRGRTWRG